MPKRNLKVTGKEGNSFRFFTWKAKEQGNFIAFIVAVSYKIRSTINVPRIDAISFVTIKTSRRNFSFFVLSFRIAL
jgi:hypothetical protein